MINKYEIINNLVLQLQTEINLIDKLSSKLILLAKDNEGKNFNNNSNFYFSSIEISSSILQKKKIVNKLFEILNEEIKISKLSYIKIIKKI
jgi:hypothetical protein